MSAAQVHHSSSFIRHPWFSNATQKRKDHDVDEDEDDGDHKGNTRTFDNGPVSSYGRPPPTKRRRFSGLENGFAHLSLHNPLYQQPPPPIYQPHNVGFGGVGNNAVPLSQVSSSTAAATTTKSPQGYQQIPPQAPPYSYQPPAFASTSSTFWPNTNAPPIPNFPSQTDVYPALAQPVPPVPGPSSSYLPYPDSSTIPVSAPIQRTVTPTIQEVDIEDTIPEVRMKTSSWYEPEPDRIVVTDLDSFADEGSDTDEPRTLSQTRNGDNDGTRSGERDVVTISSSLLERIRAQNRARVSGSSSPSTLLASDASQALVLYRPLPRIEVSVEEPEEIDGAAQGRDQGRGMPYDIINEPKMEEVRLYEDDDGDYAMDVEP